VSALLRLALRAVSLAGRVDVREDYQRMRRLQRRLAALPPARYRTPTWDTFSDAPDGHRVPVRVFTPERLRREELLLFFHGGGWVTGDIESYTPACATRSRAGPASRTPTGSCSWATPPAATSPPRSPCCCARAGTASPRARS
jgi:acetyl esterase/lipase